MSTMEGVGGNATFHTNYHSNAISFLFSNSYIILLHVSLKIFSEEGVYIQYVEVTDYIIINYHIFLPPV